MWRSNYSRGHEKGYVPFNQNDSNMIVFYFLCKECERIFNAKRLRCWFCAITIVWTIDTVPLTRKLNKTREERASVSRSRVLRIWHARGLHVCSRAIFSRVEHHRSRVPREVHAHSSRVCLTNSWAVLYDKRSASALALGSHAFVGSLNATLVHASSLETLVLFLTLGGNVYATENQGNFEIFGTRT